MMVVVKVLKREVINADCNIRIFFSPLSDLKDITDSLSVQNKISKC